MISLMAIKYYNKINWFYFMEVILTALWNSRIITLESDYWNNGQIHSPGGRSSHNFFNNWKKKRIEGSKDIKDINNIIHRPALINIVNTASGNRKIDPIMPETMFFSSAHRVFTKLIIC